MVQTKQKGRIDQGYAILKYAKQNGIPCSLYVHRILDLGWNAKKASTQPPSEKEIRGNKRLRKGLKL